jgi:aarF domain-containing kinase
MPNWQMEVRNVLEITGAISYMISHSKQVMSTELGPDWRSNFATFDPIPFASASIGQVHRATLSPLISPSTPYRSVAVKVQFPNIKSSIHSDLRNLSLLLHTSRLLPRGLFLKSSLAAMAAELDDECNYIYEANAARRFGSLLKGDARFDVMGVVDDLSTANVLTMQQMEGVPIVRAAKWSQAIRDEVCFMMFTLYWPHGFALRLRRIS